MNLPVWLALGPLIAVNTLVAGTCIWFALTYSSRPPNEDIDRTKHSRLLSRFLKEYWYWFWSPFETILVRMQIRPNTITTWGLVLSGIAGCFFHLGMLGMGGWLMIFGATADLLDGRVARRTGAVSASGAFFDSVMDRFGEGLVFLGIASYYHSSWVLYPTIIALIGSLMVSYTRARGEAVGIPVKEGIMQRAERIVYIAISSIFSPIVAHILHIRNDFFLIVAVIFIAIMANGTAFYRMRYVVKTLDVRR